MMRDRSVSQLPTDEAVLRALGALANSFGHFVGFAQSVAHQSVRVAGDHQGTETETAAALDHLGETVDVDHLFFYIEPLLFNSFSIYDSFSHPPILYFIHTSRHT